MLMDKSKQEIPSEDETSSFILKPFLADQYHQKIKKLKNSTYDLSRILNENKPFYFKINIIT